MDEKVFNLLETMYADLSSKIDNMDNELKELKINVATKHDIVRLENKMDENDKALYDGYKLSYEKLEVLEEKVKEIDIIKTSWLQGVFLFLEIKLINNNGHLTQFMPKSAHGCRDSFLVCVAFSNRNRVWWKLDNVYYTMKETIFNQFKEL